MTVRDSILKLANRKTGVTAFEVTNKLGVSRSTASAALTELSFRGDIEYSGNLRKNPSTGRQNFVYTVA